MKIGFIADIHIKLEQKGVPEDWARARFRKLFGEIFKQAEEVDAWVLGGDIFDKVPSMSELELYFELISRATFRDVPVYIIPGNHESVKKNTTFLTRLKYSSRAVNNNLIIFDDYYTGSADDIPVDFIPYNKLKEFADGKCTHEFSNRVLVTHVRGEIPPHVKPEVPLELFERWDVVLAGDLHSYDNCQRNILYPGSPVTTSFHRTLVDTGFIILDTDTLEHEWRKFEVPQLIRKTVKAGEPTPQTDYHHTVYEVEGSLTELASLEAEGLIDKKIIRKTTDTSLMLDPKMSMRDEAVEYLTYILQLDEQTIESVLTVYDNETQHFAS